MARPAPPGPTAGVDAKLAARVTGEDGEDGQPWAAGGGRTAREMCVWVGETHLAGQPKGRTNLGTAGTERQFKMPDIAARDGDR